METSNKMVKYLPSDFKKIAVERQKDVGKVLRIIDSKTSLNDKISFLKEYLNSLQPIESLSEKYKNKEQKIDVIRISIRTHSRDLPMLIYKPTESNALLPVVYHIHGGGFLSGDVQGGSQTMLSLAKRTNSIIVDINYGLSPVHSLSQSVEDCHEGLVWINKNYAKFDIDKNKVVVIGESAGGGLAASLAIKERDLNGPKIKSLFLIAPMLDHRNITPSSYKFDSDWPFWPRTFNIIAWQSVLLNKPESDDFFPYASPSMVKNLSNLPPTYIEVGNLEVFRDEAMDFAMRMMQQGSLVELHVYPEIFHTFEYEAPQSNITKNILEIRLKSLENALKH